MKSHNNYVIHRNLATHSKVQELKHKKNTLITLILLSFHNDVLVCNGKHVIHTRTNTCKHFISTQNHSLNASNTGTHNDPNFHFTSNYY